MKLSAIKSLKSLAIKPLLALRCDRATAPMGCFLLASVAIASLPATAQAQVIPDATLGPGNQSVTSTLGNRTDITGGLRRSSSLFHSFSQFNVNTLQQVYFANPAGIRNIFSRVTGGNLSSIDGTLGVAGPANLFLMNPSGIIFGPNARLDIAGSFFATTADALVFPDGQRFASTGDRAVPLVEVNIPIGLQFGANPPAMITNRGILATGQDLTLAAGNLDLQGQLLAGGHLTLNATDTVRIRDTVTEPFLARSGGNLTIQGNQGIDILTLNHLSQTPFVSGGDMRLVSDGPISTDAHFTSGGDFTIRTLAGEVGNFLSLHDPIITAAANFDVGNYLGASLQVNAGGNITYGNVVINALDAAVDPFRPAFILNAGGTITANGNVSTTVPGGVLRVDFTAGGNITIANPDPTTPLRSIIAQSTATSNFSVIRLNSTGGSVILNRAALVASNENPAATAGAGDIFIRAAQNVQITDSVVESSGDFGRIFIGRANAGDTPVGEQVSISRSVLTATNSLSGTGGLININVPGTAAVPGTLNITGSSLQTASENQAQGGEINLTVGNAGNININSSFLDASISGQGGTGARNPGVRMNATNGTVAISNNSLVTTGVSTGTAATAIAGPIEITAGTVRVEDSSALNATTAGAAPGGDITINANDVTVQRSSQINTSVQRTATATATGGNINITTTNFTLDQGGRVQARTFSGAAAGNIQLTFTNTARIANFDTQSQLYSGILTDTLGAGAGGNLTINSVTNPVGTLTLENGGSLSARTTTTAPGGNINIHVNNLNVLSGGQVLTASSSFGDAGDITVNAVGNVVIVGSRSAPTPPTSPFSNPTTFTILELDGRIPATPTQNALVEQSDTIPFISLQRNPTGAAGRILTNPNPTGNAVIGGTDLGAISNFDYYGFTVTQDGSRAIFDIDNNASTPISAIDTELFLFDALTGQLLANNDDFFPATAGSTSGLDSRLAFNFNSAGRYVLGVGRFNSTASSGNPITGTALAAGDAYRLQVSLENPAAAPGTVRIDLSDRNPNQGFNSGLFSNTQPSVDVRVPGSGTGGNITVVSQTGQINLSDRGTINASTAGLGAGGNVLLHTGGGPVSITGGARVETRSTGVGNASSYGGDAGNIVINSPDITIAGSVPLNGQPFYSGLLASADTAKSGRGGSITINDVPNGALPGNRLLVTGGAFLSTLNRSDQNGRGIEVHVANLQLLDGGQIITAAEGLGRAGDINVFSPNVQIAGTNAAFIPPPALPNGSGVLPTVSGLQAVNFAALTATPDATIDFSTSVPHATVQGQGGNFDFYRLDNVDVGNRIVADIDNSALGAAAFDTQLFLFDSAGNLLAQNDDSRAEGAARGTTSSLDSYLDYTFTTPGTYFLGIGEFASTPVPGTVALTGNVPDAGDRYTLHLGVDQRNTLNPNQSASSGLFAQSTAVSGAAGNITVTGGGAGLLNLQNGAQISAETAAGGASSPANITLQGLQTVNVTNSLISSSTTSGTAGGVTINASGQVNLDGTFINNSGVPVGGIAASARQGGNAGGVTINTPILNIANGASVAVSSTNGAGTAGEVNITASAVTLSNAAQISAETDAGGATNPANINLQGLQTLNVTNSLISSSTNSGTAGGVTVNAAQRVALDGTFIDSTGAPVGGIAASARQGGNAGGVTINTAVLDIANGASVAVSSANGFGTAGNIAIAANTVTLNNAAQISAETDAGGATSPASITLQGLQTLAVNNSLISSSTNSGTAGGVTVNAAQRISLDGTFIDNRGVSLGGIAASARQGGNAGGVTLTTSVLDIANGASVAVSSANGFGTAGNIAIAANTVTLNNAAQISAETDAGGATSPANITLQGLQTLTVNNSLISSSTNSGTAGGITANVAGRLTLSGTYTDINGNEQGGIAAAARQGGNAGSVNLTAGRTVIEDGARVTVSSPTGQAGNLSLRTNDLRMNRGTIEAITGGGNGANINIQVLQGLLVMRFRSLISADAGSQANGGNITINAPFIIGLTFENSDITANAVQGRGGNIDITTNGIFGLQFRPRLTPLSDITASSQFGLSGNVVLNTLNIEPTRGLTPPPILFTDITDVAGSACEAIGAKAGASSELRLTGRGGVPISPTAPLPAQLPGSDWVSLELSPQVPIGVTLPDGEMVTLTPGGVYELQATCVKSWQDQQRSHL